MFWKLIPITLYCVLSTVGCHGRDTRLTFAVGGAPSEVEYWEKIAKEFTDSTNIEVVILRQPTDTDQRRQGLIIPLKAQKNDPDVFLMDVVWVAQFAASHWLMPLTRLVESGKLQTDHFFESVLKTVDSYENELVALPVYNDCGLLYYRRDLLEKHHLNPPTTWSELISSAETIQSIERMENPQFYGFLWQGAQYEGLICTYLEFVASHGGTLVDRAGNIIVTGDRTIEAARMMKAMVHEYKISPPNTYTEMKEEEVRLSFESGNALYARNWPYAWGLHTRQESPISKDVGVYYLPKAIGGRHAATLGGWHIGISRFSDQKEQAVAFINFVTSYDIQRIFALDLGWNPGRSDVYDDDELRAKMPHIRILKQSFEDAVARPNIPYYTQVSEVLQRYLNAILAGESPADVALGRAQQEIDAIVKIYHD